jgi:hypothetical protein
MSRTRCPRYTRARAHPVLRSCALPGTGAWKWLTWLNTAGRQATRTLLGTTVSLCGLNPKQRTAEEWERGVGEWLLTECLIDVEEL